MFICGAASRSRGMRLLYCHTIVIGILTPRMDLRGGSLVSVSSRGQLEGKSGREAACAGHLFRSFEVRSLLACSPPRRHPTQTRSTISPSAILSMAHLSKIPPKTPQATKPSMFN